jgi:hypothetical protein
MNTNHTPGPWQVRGRTNVFPAGGTSRIIANCAGYSTNGPDWEEVNEENEANARLIAAAPDLLAALRMVALLILDPPTDQHELNKIRRAAQDAEMDMATYASDAARAAIALAEGGE